MNLRHQLKDQNVEREVSNDLPLGFFISNKLGGLLFFDAKNDATQYFARLGTKTYKVLHQLGVEGGVTSVNNRFHTLEVARDQERHDIFVPYYMNAFFIGSRSQNPARLVLQIKDLESGAVMNQHALQENEGRILLTSTDNEGKNVYTAVVGENMSYDHRPHEGGSKYHFDFMSSRTAVAISEDGNDALAKAEHLFQNEQKIKEIQDNYVSTSAVFKDPEAAMAYACVLNTTDNMFMQGTPEDQGKARALPHFSDVTGLHTAIAAQVMLTEGEYGMVKKKLLTELHTQKQALSTGKPLFEDAAWPIFIFGKMLNRLCADKKLYNHFTKDEIRSAAEDIVRMTNILEETFFPVGLPRNSQVNSPASQALMLSVYNLAYALTKSEEYSSAERLLKQNSLNKIVYGMVDSIKEKGFSTEEEVGALLLTAYIYPMLLGEDEWKHVWDSVLGTMHHNFKTLRKKMSSESGPPRGQIHLERFAITNLAAIVLNKLDAEHYESDINSILRSSVTSVLYQGVIGRPTSAYDQSADPENRAIIENAHLLNNALFIEMLRECA